MSRTSPRYVPPGSLVEITASTVGQRFLLVPCKELDAGILAVLGRALAMYPVELHAVAFMSNHWHALVSVADLEALTRFVQFVHSNIARLVQRLRGWDGSVFTRASYIIVGESAEEDRLRYVLAQGVKEGLVRRCVDWPGVHCARALLLEEVCVGRWRNTRHARNVRDGGREPLRGEIETVYPIHFAPLPSWRHLDAGERRIRVKALVDDIEATARSTRDHVLGVSAVLAQHHLTKTARPERTWAAPIHTVDMEERIRFTGGHITFSNTYYDARKRLYRGTLAPLPANCFAPLAPFHPQRSALWSLRDPPPVVHGRGDPPMLAGYVGCDAAARL